MTNLKSVREQVFGRRISRSVNKQISSKIDFMLFDSISADSPVLGDMPYRGAADMLYEHKLRMVIGQLGWKRGGYRRGV